MSTQTDHQSTKLEDRAGFWITEDQFIHMLQSIWGMGYAVVPSMPIDEAAVRKSYESLSDTFCAIEFPGDLFEMMQRVSARDQAEGR